MTALKANNRTVLVIDVGGTSVKVLATGQDEPRRFLSGPGMKPKQMVSGVKQIVKDWEYDVVSIGYPGLVHRGNRLSSRITWGANGLGLISNLHSGDR